MKTVKKAMPARNECPSCFQRLRMFQAANRNFVGYSCPKCSTPLRIRLLPKLQLLGWFATLAFAAAGCISLSLRQPDPPIESMRFDVTMALCTCVFFTLTILSPTLLIPWWFGCLERRDTG